MVGSLNVLEGARLAGTRKVVFASSGGTIYGEPTPAELPVKESHPQQPLSPYGVAKRVVTDYLHVYRELHSIEFTSLAMANVYGPRQDPHGEAGVIAIFCGKLLDGGKAVIFGDGTQTRDYVFVEDVVDANLRAAESDVTGPINIGLGQEKSVLDIVEVLNEHSADGFAPEHAPERPGEVQRIALDPSRAREQLGWEPKVELAEGLGRTLDSLR